MKIKVVNSSPNELPKFATEDSAGMDLRADLAEEISINPGQRCIVSTGIKIAIPPGYEAQIRPRSGLAIKHGVTVLNSPGTIDADYRGDIGVILINLGQEPFLIKSGDRIAQMIINKFERFEWNQSETLDETLRGEGGFGHSGRY
ncbi:MAG: dUTP diphosphatase [Schleiferiaceae bacterium]|mgnify:FL=1|jgi:dUTP pyrophosphatase|nr:dUTP diphosphatase [Schleiferiaceae bacterium]MDG1881575.1 dUTP diphosphatase [Schleiferiaceae bacterium]|tara:strand:- start:2562 stop:2996 length:435 start_codon:yes stop_codon:yes gene_type:complete